MLEGNGTRGINPTADSSPLVDAIDPLNEVNRLFGEIRVIDDQVLRVNVAGGDPLKRREIKDIFFTEKAKRIWEILSYRGSEDISMTGILHTTDEVVEQFHPFSAVVFTLKAETPVGRFQTNAQVDNLYKASTYQDVTQMVFEGLQPDVTGGIDGEEYALRAHTEIRSISRAIGKSKIAGNFDTAEELEELRKTLIIKLIVDRGTDPKSSWPDLRRHTKIFKILGGRGDTMVKIGFYTETELRDRILHSPNYFLFPVDEEIERVIMENGGYTWIDGRLRKSTNQAH